MYFGCVDANLSDEFGIQALDNTLVLITAPLANLHSLRFYCLREHPLNAFLDNRKSHRHVPLTILCS
jgi:hypothetical protein